MSDIDLNELAAVVSAVNKIQIRPTREPNFFDVGGKGYLENPTSDLMALFMGGNPSVPPWLGKAVVACLVDQGLADDNLTVDWSSVTAEREVSIAGDNGGSKFLDIVFSDGNCVVGIENKVYASSDYNPFSDYDRLLQQRARGGPVLKCILQAYPRGSGVERTWPILTYADLVEKALSLYGRDVVTQATTKWHFFYQEFLLHLKRLSGANRTNEMNDESMQFVLQHFDHLRKAARLLDAFESDLTAEGSRVVSAALSGDGREVAIKTGYGNWNHGKTKALRFFPNNWGGISQVVIYYFPDVEDGIDGSIGFGVCAYIDRKFAKRQLEDVQIAFEQAVSKNKLPASLSPRAESVLYEQSKRLLCIDCWPAEYTRAGALVAVTDLAKWVQKNAFQPAQ